MTHSAQKEPKLDDAQERDKYLVEAMNRMLSQLLEERDEAQRQAVKAELAAVAARGHATEIEKMISALTQFLGKDAEELTTRSPKAARGQDGTPADLAEDAVQDDRGSLAFPDSLYQADIAQKE